MFIEVYFGGEETVYINTDYIVSFYASNDYELKNGVKVPLPTVTVFDLEPKYEQQLIEQDLGKSHCFPHPPEVLMKMINEASK